MLFRATMTRPRLLLVDDSTGAREAFCALLDLLDYDVTGVGLGLEALRLLDRESFDAVVLDPRLPDIDGFDVLRMARSRPEWPVSIVFSGSAVSQRAAEAAGCDAFIRKPAVDEVVCALTVLLVERLTRELERTASGE
jgi:CheY-like chemotaxis protein